MGEGARPMTRERGMAAKEVHDVRLARWEGFKRLARRLPNHHILSVELIRTRRDETAAVFTVVRNHVPVQHVVMGDAYGRVKPTNGGPYRTASDDTSDQMEVITLAEGPTNAADPDIIALGQLPSMEPPPPGIVAVGAGLLAAAFDVGELIPASEAS
jgi:hypothetical protein